MSIFIFIYMYYQIQCHLTLSQYVRKFKIKFKNNIFNYIQFNISCILSLFIIFLMNLLHKAKYLVTQTLEQALNIKYHVNNITYIRGLQSEPYINIEGQKIVLKPSQIVQKVVFPSSKSSSPEKPLFMNKCFDIYNDDVLLRFIIGETFYLRFDGFLYCILNNDPLVEISTSADYSKTMAPAELQNIVRASLNELKNQSQITNKQLRNILIKNTMEGALNLKIQKVRMKQLIKIVDNHLKIYQTQLTEIKALLNKQAAKRVSLLSYFIVGQAAFLNYLIYFHFSWDIMEPVTNILGNIGLMCSYYFFIIRGRPFSLESVYEGNIDRRKNKIYKKYNFNVQKYEQLMKIKQYLTFRYSFLSKNQNILLEQFDKDFVFLDTR